MKAIAGDLYRLTKPGIIRGNLITAMAGLFLASQGWPGLTVSLGLLAGLGLVIASACVTNNFLDRHLDTKMERTKQRALAAGRIRPEQALIYAAVLGAAGTIILYQWTTGLATAIAWAGWLAYVVVYGYAKRQSTWGTAIGSFSGAIPPVVGYTAASGQLSSGAVILFAMLAVWQLPHFYAISLFRLEDYRSAGLPVLPAVQGTDTTRQRIITYAAGFAVIAPLLWLAGYSGWLFGIGSLLLGLWWAALGWRQRRQTDTAAWGKAMFLRSLVVLSGSSVLLAIDALLA